MRIDPSLDDPKEGIEVMCSSKKKELILSYIRSVIVDYFII